MPAENEPFVINPYIAGSPVKDADMFFGREDVYAWLRQHLRGKFQDNVIVLFGQRRSGKTSILYQMKRGLDDDHYIPILLDLQSMGLEGVDGFLWEVARKIVLGLRGVEGVPLLDRPARRDFEKNPRDQFENIFLPPIIATLGERRLLLMFDETDRLGEKVQAGELSADVLDYLRALAQQVRWLNFLFTLGTRVGEGPQGTSELFNLAVYRKISFLDRDFAEDLITKPVAAHYSYTEPTIERILRLTAGQPYYTQLLCHNLFTRWANRKSEQLDIEDVEAVLPDVIEQGTANLQFTWEDSTPVEKAILAALADRAPRYKGGVLRRNLVRALRRAKLYPPSREVTGGLKSLFERDVLNNQEPYEYRVEILQLWLTEYKRLEWVREELGEVVEKWERLEEQRRTEAPTPLERAWRWAAPVLGVLLLGVLIITFGLYQSFQRERRVSETRVAELKRTSEAIRMEAEQSQADLSAAQTAVADALNEGESAQVAEAIATAKFIEETATAIAAAAIRAAEEQATVVAQLPDMATEDATTNAEIVPTSTRTPTETQIPTDTPTPIPPTFTVTPSPTPRTLLASTLQGTIAYPVFDGQTYHIYFGDVASGETRRYRNEASQPAFNNNGSRIAFLSWAGSSRGLITASSNGGNQVQITNALEDKLPAWSPDSNTILFFSRRAGDRRSRLYFAPANVDFLSSSAQSVIEGQYPSWGANDEVVFKGWGNTAAGLRLTSDNFNQISALTMSGDDSAPMLSPDGKQVAYMARSEGNNWDIYVTNVDGSNQKRLTTNIGRDGLPTWSPDGRAIAFVSERDAGAWIIMATDTSGSIEQQLFEMEGSPDGKVFFDQDNSTGWLEERMSWAP